MSWNTAARNVYILLGIHILLSAHSKHYQMYVAPPDFVRVCRLYLNTGVSYFVNTGSKVHFPTAIVPLKNVLTLT